MECYRCRGHNMRPTDNGGICSDCGHSWTSRIPGKIAAADQPGRWTDGLLKPVSIGIATAATIIIVFGIVFAFSRQSDSADETPDARMNCQQLRQDTGLPGPFDQSSPHYRPDLDGDGDGLACEPYRQRER